MTITSEWPVLAACLGRDLVPNPAEIDLLAGRIWRETHPDGCAWSELPTGSEQRRFTVAVAHAAVGLPAGEIAEPGPPQVASSERVSKNFRGVLRGAGHPAKDGGSKAFSDKIDGSLSDQALGDGDYAVLAAFRRDLRAFLRFSESAAEAAGITAQQYQVLLALRASPDGRLAVGELADQMLLAPHSASGLVSRLETAELIERLKPQGDARRVDIRIATRGAEVLSSLAKAHREELKQLRPMLEDLVGRLHVSKGDENLRAGSFQDSDD